MSDNPQSDIPQVMEALRDKGHPLISAVATVFTIGRDATYKLYEEL